MSCPMLRPFRRVTRTSSARRVRHLPSEAAFESLESRLLLAATGVEPRHDVEHDFDAFPVSQAEPLVGEVATAYAASGALPTSLANTFKLHSFAGANHV